MSKEIQTISKEEHEAFFKAYSEQISKQIEYIYIDLTYLQDIYLGGILNLTEEKDVYSYILKQLKKYNLRIDNNYASYFPELNLTNEEIINYVSDKNNSKLLMIASPATDMYKYLGILHKKTLENNKCKIGIKNTIRKLTYIINTYPLILDNESMKFLKKRFILSLHDPIINFGIISKPCNSLSIDTYKKFDKLYISDMSSFSDEESTGYQALYKSGILFNSTIYTEPKITNPEVLKSLKEMDENKFMNMHYMTLLGLSIFTNIKYLRSQIWIE